MINAKKVRHILGVSGGKDSTALAIYMRDKVKDVEYFFCDTGSELQETYDYLAQLEKFLGRPIEKLKSRVEGPNGREPFEYWLDMNAGYLPSERQRWCTVNLKLKPIEEFCKKDHVISYVGIRADEESRKGYLGTPTGNIKSVFPFIDDRIDKAGVLKILKDSGVGLPKYYEWRSRSGCYFCFFQRKIEWVGLLEHHPDLFKRAMSYEKFDTKSGKRFTWMRSESLEELMRPERLAEIKRMDAEAKRRAGETAKKTNRTLAEVLIELNDEPACLVCHL